MGFNVKKFLSDAESALKHFVGQIAKPVEQGLEKAVDTVEESVVEIGISALPPVIRTILSPIAEHLGGDIENELNELLEKLERRVEAWANDGVSLHVEPAQVASFEAQPLGDRLAEVKAATAKKGE